MPGPNYIHVIFLLFFSGSMLIFRRATWRQLIGGSESVYSTLVAHMSVQLTCFKEQLHQKNTGTGYGERDLGFAPLSGRAEEGVSKGMHICGGDGTST